MDYSSDVLKFAEYLATQVFTPIYWGGWTNGFKSENVVEQVVKRLNDLITAGVLPGSPDVKTIETMVNQAIEAGVDITKGDTAWWNAMSEPYSKHFSGNAYGLFGESCPANLSAWNNVERDNVGLVLERGGEVFRRIDPSVIARSSPADFDVSDIITHNPDRLPYFESMPNNEPGAIVTPDRYVSTTPSAPPGAQAQKFDFQSFLGGIAQLAMDLVGGLLQMVGVGATFEAGNDIVEGFKAKDEEEKKKKLWSGLTKLALILGGLAAGIAAVYAWPVLVVGGVVLFPATLFLGLGVGGGGLLAHFGGDAISEKIRETLEPIFKPITMIFKTAIDMIKLISKALIDDLKDKVSETFEDGFLSGALKVSLKLIERLNPLNWKIFSEGKDKESEPMADGLLSSPTRMFAGEYPGARRNPEVIAPLDKLRGIMQSDFMQGLNAFMAMHTQPPQPALAMAGMPYMTNQVNNFNQSFTCTDSTLQATNDRAIQGSVKSAEAGLARAIRNQR